jgi:hypothetical protein
MTIIPPRLRMCFLLSVKIGALASRDQQGHDCGHGSQNGDEDQNVL